jgi:hypothetical protein
MTDREILPDNVKPIHYNVSLRDLEFKDWTYQGTVTYVSTSRMANAPLTDALMQHRLRDC